MRPLFVSYVCDWCDGLCEPCIVDRGWVLWSPELEAEGTMAYLFRTREMAEYYRSATGVDGIPRQVVTETAITWTRGRGKVPNLELADRQYSVYPDFRFEPGPYRAFLAPDADDIDTLEVF
jgi:hypothetical protein